jgi:transcriptional regulator with XRE-family HTH domain
MKLNDFLLNSPETEAEFGARIDCSQSQVNRIRHGKSEASAALIAKIRHATGGLVDFDDFYPAERIEIGEVAQ